MLNAFSRSWQITKLCIEVIKKDRELLLFPILSGIFSAIFVAAMLFPTIISSALSSEGSYAWSIFSLILIFLVYLGLAFIATFFNVCTVYTTKKRFEGGNATFGESIGFAVSKLHLIFLWGLLSATVGLILQILDNLAEKAGEGGRVILKIINSILGMIWSIIIIFVVPGMVYHNLGPFAAIKKSIEVLKKTWGESLIRHYGTGLLVLIMGLIGLILSVILTIMLSSIGPIGTIIGIGLGVLYFVVLSTVFSLIDNIFNTALYVYADTGRIPTGFDQETIRNAFQKKQ